MEGDSFRVEWCPIHSKSFENQINSFRPMATVGRLESPKV